MRSTAAHPAQIMLPLSVGYYGTFVGLSVAATLLAVLLVAGAVLLAQRAGLEAGATPMESMTLLDHSTTARDAHRRRDKDRSAWAEEPDF